MIKIMVVDDENIVIESIQYIVKKNFDNVFVVGTARSGREAIEKAETARPDLIFMDIKMPGINGIDAIKEIKSIYPHVQFVILSACEQFEFAKEAVNLGVVEYLLKPVNRMKIIEIIRQAERNLVEIQEKRKKEWELKEKFERVMPVLEHGFIYSILLYEDYNGEIDNYKRIFGLSDDSAYIMSIEFGDEAESGSFGNVIGTSVKSQGFYPIVRDIIKSRLNCIIGPVMLNRIIIYVPDSFYGDDYSQRLEAVSAAEYILDKLAQKVKVSFRIGIGSSVSGSDNILTSFTESLRAVKHANEKEIMHIHDISEEKSTRLNHFMMREKQLIEHASAGNTGECLTIFNQIFTELSESGAYSVDGLKGRLLELVVILNRLALDYCLEERDAGQNYLKEFMLFSEPVLLKNWCKKQIEIITTGIKAARARRCNNLINIAKEYIEAHYHQELALEDVSREVNLSPHYFSRFFKEETGENFIDYLTQLRMNRAKTLLEAGQLSIKEICFKVGYNDPNYFSRIFKKFTSYSPSDYKS